MPSWRTILDKVNAFPEGQEQVDRLVEIKNDYLRQLAEKTGRNVIAYYSSFLQKSGVPDLAINDRDINAFL